jgi:hypothetical protein
MEDVPRRERLPANDFFFKFIRPLVEDARYVADVVQLANRVGSIAVIV